MRTFALIVAAGRGHRAGGALPKQYRKAGGQPLLWHSASVLSAHPHIDGVRVVIHPDDRPLYDAAVTGLDLLSPVAGGATRQESVLNGLESLSDLSPTQVLIHDAARPFLSARTIDAIMASLADQQGVLVAIPVVDTLKRADGGLVRSTVDRENLWRAQTPQAFAYQPILDAHRAATGQNLTDDVAVAEAAGIEVGIVEGGERNFKVTTEEDLARADRILAPPLSPRVGSGYDVHAFGDGDHLWLCGVRVDHDQGLVGHSDADVGLHALTDAVLGAIGAQDIGYHFSDKDPAWKGASSDRFLQHAFGLVADRGGRVQHLDLTLICEAPKLRPHHEIMVARVAEITGLRIDQISIKATTTEQLGFTGRREGIAGQAVATVMMPDAPPGPRA